jgi:hypothetical protein
MKRMDQFLKRKTEVFASRTSHNAYVAPETIPLASQCDDFIILSPLDASSSSQMTVRQMASQAHFFSLKCRQDT